MTLITLENVERSFGDFTVFAGADLQIDERDRIGVVGENGAGKTTLVRVLAGIDPPDHGVRRTRKNLRVAYGAQLPELPPGATVLSAVLESMKTLNELELRLRELEADLAARPEDDSLHDEYDRVHVAFDSAGGYGRERFARTTLAGLGFSEDELDRPVDALSGGQRARVILSSLILTPSECLVLDEPTNHLDLDGIDFLENLVRARPGAVIVVSHDRRFLDAVATSIVEVEDAKVSRFRGNYSAFREQKELVLETALREYKKQQDFVAKEMDFIRRHMGSRRTAEARGRLKRLGHLQLMARPRVARHQMRLRLSEGRGYAGQTIVSLEDVGFEYPGNPVFKNLSLRLTHGEILGIVGDNGAGKTTLLDLIAGRSAPTSGAIKRPARARPGYFGQEVEELPPDMTVLRAAAERAPSKTEPELRDLLALFLFFGDDVDAEIGNLSGGERRRLSLARLLLSGFDYLCMDEPTNHLDIPTREGLERALAEFDGGVAVVSHDREFLSRVADRILLVSRGRGRLFEGGYTEFAAVRAEEKGRAEADARAERRQEKTEAEPQRRTLAPGQIRNPMELKRLEERIFEREDEQRRVRETMGSPESWKDPNKMRDLKQREQELASELEELYRRWENWQ